MSTHVRAACSLYSYTDKYDRGCVIGRRAHSTGVSLSNRLGCEQESLPAAGSARIHFQLVGRRTSPELKSHKLNGMTGGRALRERKL